MRLRVVAVDYDGTIATNGRADPVVMDAIASARRHGTVVILVTGRTVEDLRCVGANLRAFDAVVAENGAVLAFPLSGANQQLAPRPDPDLLAALLAEGLGPVVGQSIVELPADAATSVLAQIRRLELPLVIHFNRGRLMVLPQAISKATGLRAALRALRLSPHNAVAIGDAENDHELLACCELGMAVAWGSKALQRAADDVLPGAGPAAVAAFLDRIVQSDRIDLGHVPRRRLELGRHGDGSPAFLPLRNRNVLIAGDTQSGKSWLAGLIVEQLILQGYCTCVIDPEGDYDEIAALPGVQLLRGSIDWPTPEELVRLFAHPEASVVIDLSTLAPADKHARVRTILSTLSAVRRRTGLPQRILVDEAHQFLHESDEAQWFDDGIGGYLLASYRIADMHTDVLGASEAMFVTRATNPQEVGILHTLCRSRDAAPDWCQELASLRIDEAVMLSDLDASRGVLRRFRMAPRLTHHVRHEHKYLDAKVAESLAFQFRLAPPYGQRCARSLRDFCEIVAATPTALLAPYLQHADFSRWVGHVFQDATLAAELRALESSWRSGALVDANAAIVEAVRSRYRTPEEAASPLPLT